MLKKITCSYDGDSYVGTYGVVGHGEAEAVSVHFDGTTVSARLNGLRPEFAAKTLLGELVRERYISKRRSTPCASVRSDAA